MAGRWALRGFGRDREGLPVWAPLACQLLWFPSFLACFAPSPFFLPPPPPPLRGVQGVQGKGQSGGFRGIQKANGEGEMREAGRKGRKRRRGGKRAGLDRLCVTLKTFLLAQTTKWETEVLPFPFSCLRTSVPILPFELKVSFLGSHTNSPISAILMIKPSTLHLILLPAAQVQNDTRFWRLVSTSRPPRQSSGPSRLLLLLVLRRYAS